MNFRKDPGCGRISCWVVKMLRRDGSLAWNGQWLHFTWRFGRCTPELPQTARRFHTGDYQFFASVQTQFVIRNAIFRHDLKRGNFKEQRNNSIEQYPDMRHVPYRLLETVSQHGAADAPNWLIQGDNLDALKALLLFYACAFDLVAEKGLRAELGSFIEREAVHV